MAPTASAFPAGPQTLPQAPGRLPAASGLLIEGISAPHTPPISASVASGRHRQAVFNGDCSCLSLLCIYSLWAFFLKINDFLDFFVSLQAGPRPGTYFLLLILKAKLQRERSSGHQVSRAGAGPRPRACSSALSGASTADWNRCPVERGLTAVTLEWRRGRSVRDLHPILPDPTLACQARSAPRMWGLASLSSGIRSCEFLCPCWQGVFAKPTD